MQIMSILNAIHKILYCVKRNISHQKKEEGGEDFVEHRDEDVVAR